MLIIYEMIFSGLHFVAVAIHYSKYRIQFSLKPDEHRASSKIY